MELTIYISGLDDDGQVLAAIHDDLDVDVLATQERHGGKGTLELDVETDPALTREQLDNLRERIEGAGAHVNAFGPTPYVNMAQIAERIGRTPQNVLQLATGQRGPGNFPTPINPGDRGAIWEWRDVTAWLENVEGIAAGTQITDVAAMILIGGLNIEIRKGARAMRVVQRKNAGSDLTI